jgi:exonuclease SbcC
MRLHQLSVTAFGPFADTAVVDFDELSAGGVFLLTGATGAGKTSVLDAVCFALYGQVPGDRSGARHLRSDHAAPGVAPRVELVVSIGDRTFRFTRSPAWTRPKQRGSGETRVQAHVLVEERRDDDWVSLTNRLDDAGLLVSDLLGMTAAQFTQVAMLPQGRFQAFLRASSTERHAVLQKLFRTDRFERVERWLVDARGSARRASEEHAQRVVEVLSRIQEAAGVDPPAGEADDLAAAAERGALAHWSRDVLEGAEARLAAADLARAEADDRLVAADEALADARQLHELQGRAHEAARELVGLAGRADELAGLEEQLAAHRRATPLAALVSRATDCRRVADRTAARWRACCAEAGLDADDEHTRDLLATQHHDAVAALAVAEAFRPRAGELARARAQLEAGRERVSALLASVAALDEALAGLPAEIESVRTALDASQATAAELPVLERHLGDLDALCVASARLEDLTVRLVEARAELAQAKDAALAAKEVYLGVREARINGMAAELAGALTAGCACPVCGSAAHPAPAHSLGATVGRAEEDAARRAHEDAGFVLQGHEVRVATLTAEVGSLTERLAAADREALPAARSAAQEALEAARLHAAESDELGTRLRELVTRERAARDARERAAVDLATARHEADTTEAAVDTLSAELETLLDGAAPDLEALLRLRSARCADLERAVRTFAEHDEVSRAVLDADAEAEAAARAAGFTDSATAGAALLPTRRAEEIADTLTRVQAARLAAEQVLADPAVRAAAAQPPPDLDVAVVVQRLAAETVQGAVSAADAARTRSERLAALDAQLRQRLETWEPLRSRHALVADLSQLVEGKGPDNPLRIRLAAYVLSERLRQVVAAANERLARMTDRRYSLEHCDDRGAGELRGGLSLRVRDDWNGVPRDPATLSGGETFVVSLALALGLADTVAHEAGGTDIDTLFIDEGFGSLDPDTLEDVMDTLDTLRDGGRVVGLVSHVPELRSRITTQLEVVKGRGGSTLRPVLAGS